MGETLEQSPRGGLGRLALGTALFALFAPLPLLAFPLAALLMATPSRTRAELIIGVLAAATSVAWLLLPGPLPEQLVRAALVLTTVAFVGMTLVTRLSFTHRSLFALTVAAAGIALLFALFGWSWDEVTWWVRSRTSYATRLAVSGLRVAARTENSALLGTEFDAWVATSSEIASSFFPALVALELVLGMALATSLYHRVSRTPRGARLGRLSEFRFSEHLGWAAVIPLVIVLLPRLAAFKVAASNLLLVTGALYALRGLAVAVAGAAFAGSGPLTAVFAVVAGFFLLPVVLGGAVLLGVLDAGVDLRRRWTQPPASD